MTLQDVRSKIAFNPRFAPQILHQDTRAKVVLACLDEGQSIPLHREDNQGFFFVLEGEGTLLTDEGDVAVSAGQLYSVPLGGGRGMRADRGRMAVLATAVFG